MTRILVVEDEPDIQELLCAYLRESGYEVGQALDGVEALDKFRRGRFELVLLDLLLPKIDGFGVCELIRRESDVPILMLTAVDGENEALRGYGAGVDDYIDEAVFHARTAAKDTRRACAAPGRSLPNAACFAIGTSRWTSTAWRPAWTAGA